jgi:hypothetical protein
MLQQTWLIGASIGIVEDAIAIPVYNIGQRLLDVRQTGSLGLGPNAQVGSSFHEQVFHLGRGQVGIRLKEESDCPSRMSSGDTGTGSFHIAWGNHSPDLSASGLGPYTGTGEEDIGLGPIIKRRATA